MINYIYIIILLVISTNYIFCNINGELNINTVVDTNDMKQSILLPEEDIFDIILNDQNFDKIIDNDKKEMKYFIKFYAEWCGACKKLQPKWLKLKEFYKNNNEIKIYEIEVENSKDTFKRFNIKHYPTLFLITNNKVYDFLGERSIQTFADFIDSGYKVMRSSNFPEPNETIPDASVIDVIKDMIIEKPILSIIYFVFLVAMFSLFFYVIYDVCTDTRRPLGGDRTPAIASYDASGPASSPTLDKKDI